MKITIPKPCHENWEAMTPNEQGRFCSVCSKTVKDFTNASDDEMIRAFSDSSGNICGNFRESQLNRELGYSYINSLFTKFAVGFMLTAGGFVSLQGQHYSGDTLKERTDGLIIKGFSSKKISKSMVTGGGTLICEDQLTTAQKEKEPLSTLQGILGKPVPKDHSEKQLRIRGAHTSLRLREDQKPLTVLDGRVITLEELQKTDPESIETLNILKDEKATALYGAKGINGVILVTTKKKKTKRN